MRSYREVIRYLLKYMSKDEPNSTAYESILKSTIDVLQDDDPIRKAFHKILMKTIGSHDMSKQECFHILNGLDFMEFGMPFVNLNVVGTRRVKENFTRGELDESGDNNNDREIRLGKTVSDEYWAREESEDYKKACEEWLGGGPSPERPEDPRSVSLYHYAEHYNKKWKYQREKKVPLVVPSFRKIPNKQGRMPRYVMFIKHILLVYKPGTSLAEVEAMDEMGQLDDECRAFCETDVCPTLIRQEYKESQEEQDENMDTANPNVEEPIDNLRSAEEDLVIQPEQVEDHFIQDDFGLMMGPMNPLVDQDDHEFLDAGEGHYDDAEFLVGARDHDWSSDAVRLGIDTSEKFRELCNWLQHTKASQGSSPEEDGPVGASPEALNEKQFVAFSIVWSHIKRHHDSKGNVPQLLLNISGSAGQFPT